MTEKREKTPPSSSFPFLPRPLTLHPILPLSSCSSHFPPSHHITPHPAPPCMPPPLLLLWPYSEMALFYCWEAFAGETPVWKPLPTLGIQQCLSQIIRGLMKEVGQLVSYGATWCFQTVALDSSHPHPDHPHLFQMRWKHIFHAGLTDVENFPHWQCFYWNGEIECW